MSIVDGKYIVDKKKWLSANPCSPSYTSASDGYQVHGVHVMGRWR